MLLTSMFRFITFYLMIWSSLALDQSSKQEYNGDLAKFLELETLHRSPKVASACICGLTSKKCCRRKRTLEKLSLTPLETFDDRHTQKLKSVKNVQKDQVFENRVISAACICGLTSLKCCIKKRMVPKAEHGRS